MTERNCAPYSGCLRVTGAERRPPGKTKCRAHERSWAETEFVCIMHQVEPRGQFRSVGQGSIGAGENRGTARREGLPLQILSPAGGAVEEDRTIAADTPSGKKSSRARKDDGGGASAWKAPDTAEYDRRLI
ncbi:hypothetical protein NDU88_004038 [Pleurodeles waltl]|uniref:Uncharacterized protein n=1 Tax=Pleurodeles waltl TaxID=8319 RepID=A0AAV7LK76_PLEWA|nr:hypothetical protein NDU88_004038 [Pleurodeles waltl]